MPTLTTISIICSIVFGATTVYFAFKSNKRTDTKEVKDDLKDELNDRAERLKSDAVINVKLDNIATTTSDIKQEVLSIKKDIKDHETRITILETKIVSLEHDKE